MLMKFLSKIKDHRRKQGQRYKLEHILMLSIFAILSGATSYRKISAYIGTNYEVLNKIFELKWKRKPAYTTIRDIIKDTSNPEIEASFREYSQWLAGDNEKQWFICLDGKVLRGSFDHFEDQKAIQILSAFLSNSQIIIAHDEISRKTNEIPTAQEMICTLGLTNCTFTFDAINCQEKTLEAAKETGNEVIVQVKENQKTLFNDCKMVAETLHPVDAFQEPTGKEHGRIESRFVEVFTHFTLTDQEKWHQVAAIVRVERSRKVFDTRKKSWKLTDETSFYIATSVLSAELFCQAIRNHWSIENRNHYVRDVALAEDKSRIRIKPGIFAKLRSFALNILRANHVKNVSLALFQNALDINNILIYRGIL